MKTEYPSYKKTGVYWIENSLKGKNKQILKEYLNFASTTTGKRKLVDYRLYFLQFIDIMEKPLDKLTPKDMINYWSLLNQDETRSVFTKNNIKVVIKRFMRWYYANDDKMNSTLDRLRLKHQVTNTKRINKNTILKEDEIERMLRVADSLKLKAVFITLYESGARPEELRKAKWKQINWDNKTIHLHSHKTDKSREVPLNEAILHLKRWKQEFCYSNVTDEDYIFPSPYNRDEPVIEWTFRNWFKELGRKAGIERSTFPYLLRHTRLTELKNKGLDDLDRKAFAGHSPNSKMQSIYVQMDDEDMIRNVISKVYHVKELSPKKKHKLEQDVDALKQAFSFLIRENDGAMFPAELGNKLKEVMGAN